MPIDYGILAPQKPAPTILDQLGQIQGMQINEENLKLQKDAAQLRREQAQATRDAKIQDAADDAAIRAALEAATNPQTGELDGGKLLGSVAGKVTSKAYADLQKVVAEQRKQAQDTHTNEIKTIGDKAALVPKLFDLMSTDATSYNAFRKSLVGLDEQYDQLPKEYDPVATPKMFAAMKERAKSEEQKAAEHAAALARLQTASAAPGQALRNIAGALGTLPGDAPVGDREFAMLRAFGDFPDELLEQFAGKKPSQIAPMALTVEQQNTNAEQKERLAFEKEKLAFEAVKEKRIAQGGGAGGSTGFTEEALNQLADRFRQDGTLPTRVSEADKHAIVNRSGERHPGEVIAANTAEYKANSATLGVLSKQQAAVEAFEKTALKNLDLFIEQAKNIPDVGVPWANRPIRWVAENLLGSEYIPAFRAAKQVGMTEIARVVSNPNLVGVLSDTAREEVLGLTENNATFASIKRVAGILRQDMANRKTSIDEQVNAIRRRLGSTTVDPPSPTPAAAPTPAASVASLKAVPQPNGTVIVMIPTKDGQQKPVIFKTQAEADAFIARAKGGGDL